MVQRRHPLVADIPRLQGRAQEDQQRRQDGQRQDQRDDHAKSGDDAKLGHPDVRGRQKSEEPEGDRRRRQRQGAADPAGRGGERLADLMLQQSLRSEAHAELDAEIDA